ncbi:hypothetical protein P4O66_000624 [Electrophorus voltai]|uniref:Uncharacterized protein n=1 Tax=Electrophorus voltai TaxID=2609070 RepID=A0AAD8ZFL9_9TELE|nr:hypothetical protein P4O66_000624 [Electrophorus voltai]
MGQVERVARILVKQSIMEYCTPAEVNSQESYPSAQWKPTVDYSAPRSESPGQQVREAGAPVEVTADDGFPSCPSKPLAENEDAASSVMPRKQLEELFSEDSNELLDSASDSGKEFPSNSRNESDESSSDGSGSCRSSSGAPGPGAERTGGRHRKMARHLEDMHSKEQEVAMACSFPKGSKPRRIRLDELRHRGNYTHNIAGLFTKKVLWRHMKVCKLRPKEHVPKPGKNRALSLCAATLPVPPNLGEYWMGKSGESAGSRGFVRQKLRELGKLLTSGRKAVEAVRHACEYDAETNSYRIPSLAKKLAVCLAQLSRLVRTKVVTPSDSRLAQRLRDFQKIHEERWNDLLCATVARNDEEAKWSTPTLLDFTEDVQKLHAFLDKTQDERMAQLSAEPSTKFWSELAKVSLTQVILFNRSREAEVSGMYLTTFLSRDSADPPTDIDWALTEVEKQLCRHFYKIVIRRVGARPVPVLLTLRMLRALQLLAERREACGVLKDNAYVFARPSATTHYRGSDCVRAAAAACGAKDPYALTCGKLRKRIATLSTVLNLGDPETNQLANFLGHELIVHEEYYPLAERTLQLAKVYKVLTAIEQGRMMEFLGKNFSDISIPPNEEVELNNDKAKCREGSSVRGDSGKDNVHKSMRKEP